MSDEPLVKFYRFVSAARMPKRADRSAAGYLPSRAMRYCDALTSATGYGYWVFAPTTFRLLWDGEQVFWSLGEDHDWSPLTGSDSGSVQYPDFSDVFDHSAPEFLRGYSPPFLTAMPELGGVQIWSGFMVKTRPGWSLNVRAPINLPSIPGLVAWEGIVETDLWLGPLFNNFRITKTNEPVLIRGGVPLMQVQPIPQMAYKDANLAQVTCDEFEALREDDWAKIAEVLLPSSDTELRQGQYAVEIRKRRLCPVDHRSLVR